MEIVIHGHHLPGTWHRNAGVPIHRVHVGVQVRNELTELVPGDAERAEWHLDVRVVDGPDFRGPAVHGRPGARFLYLTWGDVGDSGTFAMFRRAKLMLDEIPAELIATALDGPAAPGLDPPHGRFRRPRCATVHPAGADLVRLT
jgi:hypothetical protein